MNGTYVAVNGIRLHCVTAGSGPLMLCLHGFPEFWYEWKWNGPICDPLASVWPVTYN